MSEMTRADRIFAIVKALRPADPESWPLNILYVTAEFDAHDACQRQRIAELEALYADSCSALNEHMTIHAQVVNRVRVLEEQLRITTQLLVAQMETDAPDKTEELETQVKQLNILLNNATRLASDEGDARTQAQAKVKELEAQVARLENDNTRLEMEKLWEP